MYNEENLEKLFDEPSEFIKSVSRIYSRKRHKVIH